MTDYEMADKYVTDTGNNDCTIEAYLAGLKVGRPQWHDLRKDPNDFPTEDIRLAIIEVEDCGYILCNYRKGFWYDNNSGATCAEWITNNIVRWKEIILPEEIEQ